MRKRFLFSMLVLALASCSLWAVDPPAAPAVGPPSAPAVAKAVKPLCNCDGECKCKPGDCPGKCLVAGRWSAVSIHVNMGSSSAHGSGTVIASEGGKSLVLTNAHVVESAQYPVTIVHTDADGIPWSYPATYVAGSYVSHVGHTLTIDGPDLALLQVDYTLPAAELADAIPAAGTPVQLWGFGGSLYGTTPVHRTGYVDKDPGFVEPATKTTIATINGDSGSGVFNRAGQLVAVHWGGASVRLDSIHSFTVSTVERKGIFARLKGKLAARKIAKALPSTWFLNPEPPAASPLAGKPITAGATMIPFGTSSCPNGKCPNAAYYSQPRSGWRR